MKHRAHFPVAARSNPRAALSLMLAIACAAACLAFGATPAPAAARGPANGFIQGWGSNNNGETVPPEGNAFISVSAGQGVSFAVRSDGSIVGWGQFLVTPSLADVPSGRDFVSVAVGNSHALALRSDGSIAGWGENDYGQRDCPPEKEFKAIAAGRDFSMGLKSDGSLVTWGRYDQCWETIDKFKAISAGQHHALGVRTDGSLAAHGENGSGQCDVPGGNDYVSVAGGYHESFALKTDGSIVGWGSNNRGQLNVPASGGFKAVSAGRWYGVGLKDDGSLAAWGYNAHGCRDVPRGRGFLAVACGDMHALALCSEPEDEPSVAYFAEGCTFGPSSTPGGAKTGGKVEDTGFDTYLTVANFSEEAADVTVEYFCSDGTREKEAYRIPPECRGTIDVNEVVGAGKEVSMKASSPNPLVEFERPMYFNYQGRLPGGSVSLGAREPMTRWIFAEGNTLDGYDTWVCVFNPNDEDAHLDFVYCFEGAPFVEVKKTVKPYSRSTFSMKATIGHSKNASLELRSDVPVTAERTMYFAYPGQLAPFENGGLPEQAAPWEGGNAVVGAAYPSTTWMFPEGTTRPGFDEWITVVNLANRPMDLELSFLMPELPSVRRNVVIPERQRLTIPVDEIVGEGHDVSTVLTSDTPFVAERSMYHDFQGRIPGGEASAGSTLAAYRWLFTEGCTLEGFTQYFTIMNPNDRPTELEVSYLDQNGESEIVTRRHLLPARSRVTIDAGRDFGTPAELAALLESDLPIVAERVLYFSYYNLEGSTVTAGEPDYLE